jgi:hypothetical protein
MIAEMDSMVSETAHTVLPDVLLMSWKAIDTWCGFQINLKLIFKESR